MDGRYVQTGTRPSSPAIRVIDDDAKAAGLLVGITVGGTLGAKGEQFVHQWANVTELDGRHRLSLAERHVDLAAHISDLAANEFRPIIRKDARHLEFNIAKVKLTIVRGGDNCANPRR
jgi:hypothetical protein